MNILVKNAKTLSAVNTVVSSDTESQQLFKLLGDVATSKFSLRNGYVYNGNRTTPLDMFENTQDRLRSADVLCFPADRDLSRISGYVRANVLKYLFTSHLDSTRNSYRNLQCYATPGVVIRLVSCRTTPPFAH